MAISISISPAGIIPTSEIQQTTRSVRTVDAIITASSSGVPAEVIESVTATLEENEPGVLITGGETSVTISGRYGDPFLDTFKYVDKGSSTKLQTPRTAVGASNLPPNKDYYDLDQDLRKDTTRNYTVTVIANAGAVTQTFEVTHKILNDLDGIKTFVEEYYA